MGAKIYIWKKIGDAIAQFSSLVLKYEYYFYVYYFIIVLKYYYFLLLFLSLLFYHCT